MFIKYAAAFLLLFFSFSGASINAGEKDTFQLQIRELTLSIIESYGNIVESSRKISIAVLDFETISQEPDRRDLGRAVSEMVVTEFVNNRFFRVVERKQLEKIMNELELDIARAAQPENSSRLGKLLGADAVVIGSLSEIAESFYINIRMVDVESGEAMAAASSKFKMKKTSLLMRSAAGKENIRDRIQYNLDALDIAIHNYSYLRSPEQRRVIWPGSLKSLVPEYLDRIPDPHKGKWKYDPDTGQVKNSAYPEVIPTTVYPKMGPIYKAINEAQVKIGLRKLEMGVNMYMAETGSFPEKLEDLSEYHMMEMPDPGSGRWEYDSKTGKVSHSKKK